jgi:hypothetical protein
MTIYRCRLLKPTQSNWIEIEANSPEEAASTDWSDKGLRGYKIMIPHGPDGAGREGVQFWLIEVEGHGELICRVFNLGLYRRGGVKPRNPITLDYIARELGWSGDPQELVAPGWDFEEEYAD